MRGEVGKKYKKTGSSKIETAGDFSVIVGLSHIFANDLGMMILPHWSL